MDAESRGDRPEEQDVIEAGNNVHSGAGKQHIFATFHMCCGAPPEGVLD